MINESSARKHYMNIRAERDEPKRVLGFQRPKNSIRENELFRQPYGVPSHYVSPYEAED